MSRKLILGMVSRKRLMGITPIGIVNGRPVFPLLGAEDDEPPADGGEGEGSEEDDEDEDEDEDEDKSGKDGDKKPRRPRRDSGDSSVIRNMRKELRTLKREKAEREKAERDKTLADKPEIERLTVERDDAVKELEKLRKSHQEASVELAIIRASQSARSKYNWADIEDVLNDRKLRQAIEIDDDGEISGVEEALKDLAKRKPHFLASSSDGEGSGDGKQSSNGKKQGGGNGNGKSGSNPGGGGNGDQAARRAELEKKYPVISRMSSS